MASLSPENSCAQLDKASAEMIVSASPTVSQGLQEMAFSSPFQQSLPGSRKFLVIEAFLPLASYAIPCSISPYFCSR